MLHVIYSLLSGDDADEDVYDTDDVYDTSISSLAIEEDIQDQVHMKYSHYMNILQETDDTEEYKRDAWANMCKYPCFLCTGVSRSCCMGNTKFNPDHKDFECCCLCLTNGLLSFYGFFFSAAICFYIREWYRNGCVCNCCRRSFYNCCEEENENEQ